MPLPQYAKSNDPAVLAAVEDRRAAYAEFTRRGDEVARKYGSPDGEFMVSSGFGRRYLAGLPFKPEGHGRWTNNRGRTWRPYANNPASADFNVRQRDVEIPGLPATIRGRGNRDGSTTIHTVEPFLHDGYAWHGIDEAPARDRQDGDVGPQWTEVLTSEYWAAREAVIVKQKAAG